MKKRRRRSNAQISRSYHSRMRNLLKGHTEKEIFESLSGGKNSYLRLDRLLSSSFDKSWIEMIEGCIFDLGDIISNPRLSTKEVEYIVPIELARKITAKSVQHLAANTQYIREIDEYGNVIPRKILTVAHEDDILTYENRFIATLIRRLVLFIEKRYEIVSEFAELRNEEILMFKNESLVNDALVEIETKVKVSYKSDDELSLKSNAYIARIVKIREHIQYFYNSDFMRHFKTERDVRNPIIRTNIIRKDPKYSHCYRLYRFIEKYDRLGVNYKVSDKYSLFNKKEIEELNNTIFANYVTLKGKDLKNNSQTKSRVYKPKILKSLDDEIFIYGPLVRTPISFVRVDSHYQKYLDNKIKKDLPRYPTKKEREYYATEYKEKKENAEDKKQLDSLLRRKERENRTFEKSVKNILKQREKARQALEEQEQTIIKKEEEGRLSVAREAIVTASLEHKEVEKKELEKKELEKKKVKSSASKTTKKEKKAPLKSIEGKQPEEVQRLPKKTIKKPIPIEKKPIVSTPKVKSASEETTLIEPKTETENVPIEAQTPLEETKIIVEEVKKPRAKRSTKKKETIEQPLAVVSESLSVDKPEKAVEPVGKEVATEKKTTKRVKKATKTPKEEKEAIEEKPTAEQTQAVGEISEPVKKVRKPRAKRVLEKVEPVSEIIPEDKQSVEPESNDQSSLENQQAETAEAAPIV
ncbi:MAG TPA: hypothetical protein GX010_04890, partial [Erysipelotrichaceae bacterium]|nr:hypothetical protein [Erysipelotrichaceae bacterium]